MDSDVKWWIEVLIQAVSAVATAAAVVIALWLALRESKPGVVISFGWWSTLDGPRMLRVKVENVGYQPVSCDMPVLRVGIFEPALHLLELDPFFPTPMLSHGDAAHFDISVATLRQHAESAASARFLWRIDRHFKGVCQIQVELSSGRRLRKPLPAIVAQAMLQRPSLGERSEDFRRSPLSMALNDDHTSPDDDSLPIVLSGEYLGVYWNLARYARPDECDESRVRYLLRYSRQVSDADRQVPDHRGLTRVAFREVVEHFTRDRIGRLSP